MKVIVERIPNLSKLNSEDIKVNILFFYTLLTVITSSQKTDLIGLAEELDEFFHSYGENTLRRIVFMYAYNESGLVLVTKFDYEHLALVEGDTSHIYER